MEDMMAVMLPEAVANMQLPDPCLKNYYSQEQRRVFWYSEVIDGSILEIVKSIQMINVVDKDVPVEERTPIKLYIWSEGGADVATWALVDAIAMSKTPVYTINAGMAFSNGLSLLVCGHKRFTMPHAVGMYHSGSGSIGGTSEQMDSASKYLAAQLKIYEQWFNDHAKIDKKVFNKYKKTDWYLTADDMLKHGMVDAILTPEEYENLL